MSESKHTPGPWEVDNPNWGLVAKRIHGAYRYIANCMSDEFSMTEWPDETIKANAHLIAAAPELYNACKELVRSLTDALEHNLLITAETVDLADRLARMAIAKVEEK